MKNKWRKIAWISLLSFAIVLLPMSTAWGFGKGSKGSDVYAVQGMLSSLGDFHGKITGYYGAKTISAVTGFQKRYGLPATGTVDDPTLQSILRAYGNLRITSKPSPTPIAAPKPTPAPYTSPYSTPYISPIPTAVPSPYPLTGLTADESQMIKLVNQERTAAGLHVLVADSALTQTGRLKSQDMVKLNYFAHQSPTYGSPFDMMSQFGIEFQTAGENIACNQTVAAAHQALMISQAHRDNILNENFVYIGIGIISGGPCGQMYTQQFVGR